MKRIGSLFLFCLLSFPVLAQPSSHKIRSMNDFPKIEAISFSKVKITDAFWKPRLEKVSRVTIPVCIEQTEVKTPRIRNFEKVARKRGEKHDGIYYDDSDVYKALEAIAYSLKNNPDSSLEKKADEWIEKIAAAQLPDGYLNTYYTLTGLDKRWTDMEKHEDYNAGHLIEAAVAYFNTTGKRKLLDVAIRFADHIDSTFRRQNRPWVTGHEEIELALVKLYKTTGNENYLQLSSWFLQQRGRGYGKGVIWDEWKQPEYAQDNLPVEEQKQITGHAVRAMYLYTGAADVAAALNEVRYMNAMKTVWEDVVFRNMYITGGIGSSGRNEGFTHDYDLPNETAYCETCASVGMVFWNQRMHLLTGESKYMDVLERSLYNGALDGLSLSGDLFFYGNPLASNGNHARREWFGTACCPSNIARLVSSVGDYIYSHSEDGVWINLFVGSTTIIPLKNGNLTITQETGYPWDGRVKISLQPDKRRKFRVAIRIPGWAQNTPVPGTTYQYLQPTDSSIQLLLNGKKIDYDTQNGYALIERRWKKDDIIDLHLPMPVQRVVTIDSVKENTNRVAMQRGPIVYCVEGVDNDGKAHNIILPDKQPFTAGYQPHLLGGIVTIQTETPVVVPTYNGEGVTTITKKITAIPYFSWANRGRGEMQVWIPRKITGASLSTK